MFKLGSIGLFLGRLLMSIIFIISGSFKFADYDGTAQFMAAHGMTLIPLFLIAAALIELIGGLSLLFGYKTRYGAILLMVYLIPVTLVFHNFWTMEGVEKQMQMFHFLKNVAIAGGLMYIAIVGPGKLSVDTCCGCGTQCGDKDKFK